MQSALNTLLNEWTRNDNLNLRQIKIKTINAKTLSLYLLKQNKLRSQIVLQHQFQFSSLMQFAFHSHRFCHEYTRMDWPYCLQFVSSAAQVVVITTTSVDVSKGMKREFMEWLNIYVLLTTELTSCLRQITFLLWSSSPFTFWSASNTSLSLTSIITDTVAAHIHFSGVQ